MLTWASSGIRNVDDHCWICALAVESTIRPSSEIRPNSSATGTKRAGDDLAVHGVAPAHQRLEAEDRAVGEVDQRLVADPQALVLEGLAEVLADGEGLVGDRDQLGGAQLDAVAPGAARPPGPRARRRGAGRSAVARAPIESRVTMPRLVESCTRRWLSRTTGVQTADTSR